MSPRRMSCDVAFSNQSGVLKHNTLTLGMLCQGGGHGQGRSSTLNFSLYNSAKHEPPAGRWLPLPPPPSANAVSIPRRTNPPLVLLLPLHIQAVTESIRDRPTHSAPVIQLYDVISLCPLVVNGI